MKRIFLLDLDGVMVARLPGRGRTETIALLHPDLLATVSDLGFTVVVLTHRSRAEARQIVQALFASHGSSILTIAAEDLMKVALKSGRILQLFGGGVQKRFALSHLERVLNVPRRYMAALDDNDANVRGLRDAGLGLPMLTPAALIAGDYVETFASIALRDRLRDWAASDYSISDIQILIRDERSSLVPLRKVSIAKARIMSWMRRSASLTRRVLHRALRAH